MFLKKNTLDTLHIIITLDTLYTTIITLSTYPKLYHTHNSRHFVVDHLTATLANLCELRVVQCLGSERLSPCYSQNTV